MIYSVEEQKPVDEMPVGMTGQISFKRLAATIPLFEDERITHFRVTNDGIEYRIERE